MKPKSFMLIAGEASGDQLAAELVTALRARLPEAAFFGAGGPRMSAAGVKLVQDMSHFSVVGITDVLLKIFELRGLMKKLLAAAAQRQPDVIIGVDYGGFNLRFGRALKAMVRDNPFSQWHPKLVQFVSPQVWASRPGRADRMAEDYDLLLSIFPFEPEWYARRVPKLRVEFVGHPMIGRFSDDLRAAQVNGVLGHAPQIALLPGSRKSELKRHLPPMLDALNLVLAQVPAARTRMILPATGLLKIAHREFARRSPEPVPRSPAPTLAETQRVAQRSFPQLELQIGNVPHTLAQSDIAISKTGTVTMECAYFGVPAVTCYRGSWLNYQIARHFITVTTFTMPNLLANEEVYPEFLQHALTAPNLAEAAVDLLQNEEHRQKIKAQLARIITSLGPPGAPQRAADAILTLFP